MPTLPFKLNQDRRHHIPKQKHKVTNSAAYDAALRQRGSLTVWFTDEAVAAWKAEPRTTRGGQRWYSPLAILTAPTLRAVFHLALRQTEGLIGSIIHLLGLALAVPDHSTLSRRAKTLEVPRPRPCRNGEPLHLLVDSTGLKLCGAGEWLIVSLAVVQRYPEAAIIVPPRSTAVPSETAETAPTQRDGHLHSIAEHGRTTWQKASGYTKRARAEAAIGRFKQMISDGLRSRTDQRQATEVDVAVHALNRILDLGRRISVRIA